MRIGIIDWARFNGKDPKRIGSTFLRAENLIARDSDFETWKQGGKYDALIFQKCYWKEMAEVFKGPKILDLADPDFIRGEREGGVDLVEFSQHVDTITTSSLTLAEAIKKFIKHIPVEHVADRINLDIFPETKVHVDEAKTVVWFGYIGNAKKVLTDFILKALVNQGLKLIVVSNESFNPNDDYGLEIDNVKYEPETVYYEIQKADFAINPKSFKLADFKYKSNNKTIISWQLGLPVAEDGDQMRRFMDADERNDEINKRLKEVQDEYLIEKSGIQYKQIIEKMNERRNKI